MIKIRKMNNNSQDLFLLIEYLQLIDSIFPIPLSKKVNLSEYAKKELVHGVVLCAETETELVGILLGYVNDHLNHVAYLGTLGVSENFRTQGIGHRLVEEMKSIAKEAGMQSISLYTHVTNVRAIAFYEKHGFAVQIFDSDHPDYLHMLATL